jgi:hypothetical protein
VVSLSRSNAKNAIGRQLLRELQEAINTLRQERTTRCVIVRSTCPGTFCAGADLKVCWCVGGGWGERQAGVRSGQQTWLLVMLLRSGIERTLQLALLPCGVLTHRPVAGLLHKVALLEALYNYLQLLTVVTATCAKPANHSHGCPLVWL